MKTSDSGIYFIEFSKTGIKYVGSSVNIKVRLRKHFFMLNKGSHPNPKLQAYFNKYGKKYFKSGIIEVVCDSSALLEREQFWIDTLGAVVPKGFNILPKAGNSAGCKWSEDHKKAVSIRMTGKGNHFYGKEHNKKTVALLKRISKKQFPNGPMYSKKHSAETKAKMSASAKKRTTNPFKGRSWKEPSLRESLSKMKRVLSERMLGSKNPFFGKKHDRKSIGKKYRVITPDNKAFIVKNLAFWCEINRVNFETVRHSLKQGGIKTKAGWTVILIK